MSMQDHSSEVEWRFVVPPKNEERVVIMQRTDGPFRKDEIGGKGRYYVSLEIYSGYSRWEHAEGSTSGGYGSFDEAQVHAERLWMRRRIADKIETIFQTPGDA